MAKLKQVNCPTCKIKGPKVQGAKLLAKVHNAIVHPDAQTPPARAK